MNTLNYNVPHLKQASARDYVILLEDLEFVMSKEQLKEITQLHNNGVKLEEISLEVQRNVFEVLLALIHQAKTGEIQIGPLRGV